MLTKQGKVSYIKYKNNLITKITKNRAIRILHIFPTADDKNRLIIVEVSASKGRGSPPSKKRLLLF